MSSSAPGAAHLVAVFSQAGRHLFNLQSDALSTPRCVAFTHEAVVVCEDAPKHRVVVFRRGDPADPPPWDSGEGVVSVWGEQGLTDGKMMWPNCVAVVGPHLLVLDGYSKRVNVFE